MYIFLASLVSVKFIFDVVVIVLRGLGFRKNSGATFGFVRNLLGATYRFLILSFKTPMYETGEKKHNGILRMQNAMNNETLAAPMFTENPNQLYPDVHFVNNLMPISSNFLESLSIYPKVAYTLGIVPSNFNASAHRNASGTSTTFLNNIVNGNAPNASTNGNAPIIIGNASLRLH